MLEQAWDDAHPRLEHSAAGVDDDGLRPRRLRRSDRPSSTGTVNHLWTEAAVLWTTAGSVEDTPSDENSQK